MLKKRRDRYNHISIDDQLNSNLGNDPKSIENEKIRKLVEDQRREDFARKLKKKSETQNLNYQIPRLKRHQREHHKNRKSNYSSLASQKAQSVEDYLLDTAIKVIEAE